MGLNAIAGAARDKVQAMAADLGLPVTVCVLDTAGDVVLKDRQDGAGVLTLEMSERKAYTSALLGAVTKDLGELVQPGGGLYGLTHFAGGRFVAFGGGVPLFVDGELVGGLGVSGGTADQDAAMAAAGVSGADA